MKIKGKMLFFVFILLIIVGFGLYRNFYHPNLPNQPEKEPVVQAPPERIVPVQIVKVQEGSIQSFLSVSGLVEPKETVRVFPKGSGQIKEVLVKEGDIVQKEDILIRLDDEQLRLQVAQARATLDSAQANLEKVKAGARPQEISQSEAAVRQAEINRNSAEENYLRMKKLFSEGAVSEQQHDQAKNQYEIADTQYKAAIESYQLVLEGASQQDIRAVEAQARQAQSTLELAQSQLNNTNVRAPINGKVTSVNAKVGELVSSAMPVLVIVDTSELFINTGISEKDVASVKIGQEAQVLIDAFPEGTFTGEVTSKGVMVDPTTKMMEIKIKIVNSGEEIIPPGVFARANITIAENVETLVIPDTALTRKRDGVFVFVLKGETVEQRPVITGISQGSQVEILQGLEKDEEIVISGNITLLDGDRVRVMNREDEI